MLKIPGPIVSTTWLNDHLNHKDLVILDGTIQKATDKQMDTEDAVFVKNALFFDIKEEFSVKDAPFPNTMISEDEFERKTRKLGINSDSCIVVYDRYGYYSCARVWWMFKSMGFENIAVLDGGLPEWRSKGFPINLEPSKPESVGDFSASLIKGMIHTHIPVLNAICDANTTIVDARGAKRFLGEVEEPRPGLRSGHIPSAKNIPFTSILDGTEMKSKEELKTIFSEVENEHLIFSCGSGITACVLALGAELVGVKSKTVYDGSWTEWGSLIDLPIEK